MNSFKIQLNSNNATLTGYIHDKSREMPNTDIRPAVLVFPGGGYMMCSDREADPIALSYLAEGYNTFILRYSVGVDVPVSKAFEDADDAMGYLLENAEDLNIDVNKIAVIGFSAGGHLTAWLSNYGKVKPCAAILGYPAILAASGKFLGKEFPELCDKVDENTPETFIFTTRDDALVVVDHALQYALALDRAKVGFELHVFASGTHGLSLAKSHTSSGKPAMVNEDVAEWFGLSVRWLKRVLGDFVVAEEPVDFSKIDSHTPIAVLMNDEQIWKTVAECFPELPDRLNEAKENGRWDMIKGASIRQLANFTPDAYSVEAMDLLDSKLK